MKEDQELEVVKLAIMRAGVLERQTSVRQALAEVLAEQAGHAVSSTTITQMLNRVAPRIIPGINARQLQDVAGALARQWHYERMVHKMLGRVSP